MIVHLSFPRLATGKAAPTRVVALAGAPRVGDYVEEDERSWVVDSVAWVVDQPADQPQVYVRLR